MKLALLQLAPTSPMPMPSDVLKAQVAAVAGCGADLIVLPELLFPGYNQPAAHRDLSSPLCGPLCAAMADLARTAGAALAYGWAERDGEAVYNAASVFDRAGHRVGHYRKQQLFGPMERASFAPGGVQARAFDLLGHRIGLLICYDIEFPDHARALAAQGADLLLVPTANPAGFEHVQTLLVPTRAYENRQTVAYANYAGPDGDLTFAGRSVIAGPDGQPIATAGRSPATLIVDVPRAADYPPHLLSTLAEDLRLP